MLNSLAAVLPSSYVSVLLNGRVIGKLPFDKCRSVSEELRLAKIKRLCDVSFFSNFFKVHTDSLPLGNCFH